MDYCYFQIPMIISKVGDDMVKLVIGGEAIGGTIVWAGGFGLGCQHPNGGTIQRHEVGHFQRRD